MTAKCIALEPIFGGCQEQIVVRQSTRLSLLPERVWLHETTVYTAYNDAPPPSPLTLSTLFYSLLSHSAVVARELGLPTIVGVSGGLMKRLKSGMRVHVDAGKGKLTILTDNTQ